MSFSSLLPEDIVVSSDSIVSTLWNDNQTILTSFYNQSNNNSYLDIYSEDPTNAFATPQFSITYGHISGSGSVAINSLVPGNTTSRIIYGQIRTLINGNENSPINFGSGNSISPDVYVINVNRTQYKEKLFLNTFNIKLTNNTSSLYLTNNSRDSNLVNYCDAGRVYNIVSGSNGNSITTSTTYSTPGYTVSGSYGKFLPDVGLILLNPRALALPPTSGGINLIPDNPAISSSLQNIHNNLFGVINSGSYFSLNSEETITSDYIFVRVKNSDFNYTSNPSIIDNSGEFNDSIFVNNPQTFITTVGLYNDNNELLAVAKLNKPLKKDFTKELLLRIKLDFLFLLGFSSLMSLFIK